MSQNVLIKEQVKTKLPAILTSYISKKFKKYKHV